MNKENKLTNDTEIDVGMTDEEIVKAVKFCLKDKAGCDKCKVYNKNTPMLRERFIICEKLIKSVYDLIHRLQNENEQLKCDSYRTSWKAKFLEAKKEIERLTEELKYYRGELL